MSRLSQCIIVVGLIAMAIQGVLAADDLAPVSPLVVNPERQVDYTLGDLIEQRIKLHDEGYTFRMEQKPVLRRVGPWVQRIGSEFDEQQQWLTMTYQIINTPEISRWVSLPTVVLIRENNESVSIQGWQFGISPLIARPEPENTPFLQADILMPANTTGPLSRKRSIALLGLLGLLVAWISWWYWQNQRDRRRLPFARCFHEVVKQQDSSGNDDNLRRLHRAFDDTAGQSINESNLDVLFAKAPWLRAMEAEITGFYRQSATHFYALDSTKASIDLNNLSRELFKLERHNLKLVQVTHSHPQHAR